MRYEREVRKTERRRSGSRGCIGAETKGENRRPRADVAKSVDAADFRIGVPAGKSAE